MLFIMVQGWEVGRAVVLTRASAQSRETGVNEHATQGRALDTLAAAEEEEEEARELKQSAGS